MTTTSVLARASRVLSVLALAGACLSPALLPASTAARQTGQAATAASDKDVVIFRNGKQVEGQIVEETPTNIRMKVVVAGIPGETTYDRSDILQVIKATAAKTDAPATKAASKPSETPVRAEVKREPESNATRVYKMELTGYFGQDISETPIRQAVKDAKKNEADYIIVVLDNDWSMRRQGSMETLKDDDSRFEQFWRAEAMYPVLTEEIEREWTKQPKIVFWVKKAMGGAAFLPLSCPNIYFSSEGKMGGIGRVEQVIKSGDQVVKEKLIGARLGHVQGMAVKGGYDPRIVLAMARTDYVLSYRMVGGKAELIEGMPQNADEFLLTDDGDEQQGRRDDDEALARGEGNDVLTLNADVAYKLGVSKGTVDSYDDLLFKLGLSRNSETVKGQADHIMKTWRDGLDSAKRQLPKMWQEFGRVQPAAPGGYRERSQARGKQTSILDSMQQIIKRYEEALNPRQVGVPTWAELETMKKQIELQQLADKR